MRQPRWFAFVLFALAGGLVVVAALGPLALGAIQYRYTETMLNQAVGLDAFAAAVVAPVAVIAGVLALRQHPAAPLLALAASGFSVYMVSQYVIGPEYLIVQGNGEQFFLLFIAILVASGTALLRAWPLADPPAWTIREHHRRASLLLALAAFVVGVMYLSNGFLDAMSDFPQYVDERAATTEYDEHPTAFWLVSLLDLGVVVPFTIAAGVGLLRQQGWARRAFYGLIGWFALVPGSVAAMALVMVARDDPAANAAKAAVLTVAAAVFLVLAARLYRPLLTAPRNGGDHAGGRDPSAPAGDRTRPLAVTSDGRGRPPRCGSSSVMGGSGRGGS